MWKSRIPESLILLLGALLRLTMATGWRFQAEWGYDALAHWSYVQSILQGALPDPGTNYVGYHPPLYHLLAAGLVKFGASHQGITWLSTGCGVIRLAIIWLGLELYLSNRRARFAALALAAVLPSSIWIDGHTTNESLNGMLAAAAMLVWPMVFRTDRRWKPACVLGVVLGLAILAKTSAVVMLIAISIGVSLDLAFSHKHWQTRLKSLAPWAATLTICVAIGGWFYARNVAKYGAPFVTSYEVAPGYMAHVAADTPYLDRRSLGFVAGWSGMIYQMPYYPVGLTPHPRFFPVALAETFLDYYNCQFSGLQHGDLTANGRPLTARLIWLSRGAIAGGTIILIGTLAAWIVCLWRMARRRDWATFAILITPALAALVALAFAIKYPYDTHGVVKGVYIQFAAPALFAMFGLAVAHRRFTVLLLLSLCAVALYAVCCRTGFITI